MTLPQIIFRDPDYFFWAWEERVFARYPELQREAKELYHKARNIRIPDGKVVEVFYHQPTGTLAGFHVVAKEKQENTPSCRAMDRIDLYQPRLYKSYDKRGGRAFVRDLKFYLFGDNSYKMTKKRCENFFVDDSNFLI